MNLQWWEIRQPDNKINNFSSKVKSILTVFKACAHEPHEQFPTIQHATLSCLFFMAIFRQRQETELPRKWLVLDLTVHGASGSRVLVFGVVVGGLVAKSCLTLCYPMDCSLPGSSAPGILQPRILEWVAISFSRGSFQPMNRTQVSCIVGRFFTNWAMREIIWEQVQLFSLCKQRSLSFYADHFKSLLNLLQYCFCFIF